MTTLLITRGYPGSGKTTAARDWVAREPHQRTRVNRDDLRRSLFGVSHGLFHDQEKTVTRVEFAMVRSLLRAGRDVVVDDTNLRLRFARDWCDLATALGADFEVLDVTTDVEQCVKNDAARPEPVGEQIVRGFAARYRMPWPKVHPTERTADAAAPDIYVPDETRPEAWIVDVDGTLALMGDRSPFDWTRVAEDRPNTAVIQLAQTLHDAGYVLIVMSGRSEECRTATKAWLDEHLDGYAELHMRAAGDNRPDRIVKAELFDTHLRHRWNVRGVLDDRTQVVRMWRAMGLTCLQVAPGDF
ncbi:AAA family ATPase [Mumia sp. DW29H23]|uniref:phosphatase domain-containing protein n=1 Tax=Mumia sp. DW29H23 TaxID=3421241 RepID=UPI003D69AD3F